jgi:hypothetical protein
MVESAVHRCGDLRPRVLSAQHYTGIGKTGRGKSTEISFARPHFRLAGTKAVLNVDLEYSFQAPSPGHRSQGLIGVHATWYTFLGGVYVYTTHGPGMLLRRIRGFREKGL